MYCRITENYEKEDLCTVDRQTNRILKLKRHSQDTVKKHYPAVLALEVKRSLVDKLSASTEDEIETNCKTRSTKVSYPTKPGNQFSYFQINFKPVKQRTQSEPRDKKDHAVINNQQRTVLFLLTAFASYSRTFSKS